MEKEFLKTQLEISKWLDKYGVKNYIIFKDAKYGYAVNVEGSVRLSYNNLSFIPVKFSIITGNFDCSHNQLKSLEFCPKDVGGEFDCSYNNLTSLEHCPESVNKDFYCGLNQIKSLEFCPKTVGWRFYCFGNRALETVLDTNNTNAFSHILNIHKETLIKKEKDMLEQEILKNLPTSTQPSNSTSSFKI